MQKYNHKANQGKIPDDKENVLNCDFTSVMDLYARKIIDYAYGKNMTSDLALQAVKKRVLKY